MISVYIEDVLFDIPLYLKEKLKLFILCKLDCKSQFQCIPEWLLSVINLYFELPIKLESVYQIETTLPINVKSWYHYIYIISDLVVQKKMQSSFKLLHGTAEIRLTAVMSAKPAKRSLAWQ